MQFTAARAFGPAVGGLVLAAFGPATAFMANAVTFLLVISALVVVRPREAELVGAGERFVEQFRQGLAYVRARQSLVLAVVTMTAVSLFASSVVQLAPALAKDQFGVAAGGYGLLIAMFGTGAIVGVLIASLYGDLVRRSRMALYGLLIMVAGVLVVSVATAYAVGLGAFFVMGVAYLLVAVALNTSIQVRVAEAYRGRVLSIYLMGLLGGMPVGALLEGRLGDVVGLRTTVAGAGIALGLFSLYAAAHFRALRPLDEALEDGDEAPALVGRGVRVADSPAA
jgi:predicted MFS family arabinose efflux permease